MSAREVATAALTAMAHSDTAAVARLCASDCVVWGTDEGESWTDVASLIEALDGMRELGLEASWVAPPVGGDGWVAGLARYTDRRGEGLDVRVTMVIDGGRVRHAHFSVAAAALSS